MEKKKVAKRTRKINKKDKKDKKANIEKSNNGKKVKFSKRHPKIALAIRLTILITIITIVVGTGIVIGMLYGMWGSEDFQINEDELVISGNSFIYDSDGKVLAELSGDENRKVITIDEMSQYLPKAYVAIEDERFYEHNGVDIKRTGGAIFTYITHRGNSNFGGSTITQQLVKNITQEKERNGIEGITRKIKEWAKAMKLEEMLEKDQILELYLNVIFIGGGKNYHGVEVGAEYYFNKTAKDLSLVECAFMAGINNAPNAYTPYGENGYEKNENKKNKINNRTKVVLKKMLELGYINQEEYENACKEVEEGLKFEQGARTGKIYSYHTDATISKVISDIAEAKNWTRDYASTYVYGGGLKIYSTQNTEIQNKIEKVMQEDGQKYAQKSQETKDEDGNFVQSQAATVVIDNETGYAVGLVGGLGEKVESRGLNRATQSPRQTGSSIKPIADVLPALEEGLVTASTMYNDCATDFGANYKPKDEGAYRGVISLRSAITTSQNIPFVKIMAELTNPVATTYLKKMGITSLDSVNDVGLPLAIGGLYNGITTFEMAGAYATIENNGVYREPLLYTKIEDSSGNVILEKEQKTTEVCSEQNAYILKDLLKSVVEAGNGTATYCKISGIDMAAKTGTTNNHYDRWMCGFTNYYTTATWYGYDKNEYVRSNWRSPAGQIYKAVMDSLHAGKAKSTFEKPDGIVSINVCNHTGLRATDKCAETHYEIFVKGKEPKECDEASSAAEICASSGLLATEYCPEVTTQYFSYFVEKERLGLWTNLTNDNKNKPTEKCREHTLENSAENLTPTIALVGDEKVTLKVGETYTEKGAKATDKIDGEITNKIQISGSVNTSKAGTYTITYTVKNSKEITATKQRTVVVEEKEKPTKNTEKTNTTTDNKAETPTNPKETTSSEENKSTENKPTENKPTENNSAENTTSPAEVPANSEKTDN